MIYGRFNLFGRNGILIENYIGLDLIRVQIALMNEDCEKVSLGLSFYVRLDMTKYF